MIFVWLLGGSSQLKSHFVPEADCAPLPKIDAHRFDSIPIEMSKSGRVYRFSMKSADVPRVGNIVLVEENKKPTMAFRVIRSDPNKMEYVARRVRRYDNHETLILNRPYPSLEKVADRLDAPPTNETPETILADPFKEAPAVSSTPTTRPRQTARVQKQSQAQSLSQHRPEPEPTLAPLPATVPESTPKIIPEPTPEPIVESTPEPTPESTPESTDQELDQGSASIANEIQSPTPPPEVSSIDEDLDRGAADVGSGDDEEMHFEVNEQLRLQPLGHMFAVQPGIFRNGSDFNLAGQMFSGFSFSYSVKMRDDWLIRPAKTQDALWFELGGAFYSKAELTNDVYNLLPLRLELRWELYVNQTMALQFYGGIQYNWIFSTQNAINETTFDALSGFQSTFGTGILFQLGPQWYFRSDIGYDRLNFGLGIRW
jgi:hypothetical protein